MFKQVLLFLLLIFTHTFHANARVKELSSNAEFSLLTCAPGDELYSMFGHTSIRLQDPDLHIDYLFNYGVFSFQSNNFYVKFVKGETDYLLHVSNNIHRFIKSYEEDGRSVISNRLNLSHEEKQTLFEALLENSRRENRIYRYNFLFQNCATKVRDIVTESISDSLTWSKNGDSPFTYRDLIDQYVPKSTWSSFGIYLALGSTCDDIASESETMFLPDYLQQNFVDADVFRGSEHQSLASEGTYLVEKENVVVGNRFLTPLNMMCVLLLLVLALLRYENKHNRLFRFFDYILFTIAAIGGLILFYLDFFSLHPVTSQNYNLLLLSPLYFLVSIVGIIPFLRPLVRYVHISFVIMLMTFLFGAVTGMFDDQTFHPATYVLALIFMSRHIQYLNPRFMVSN